MSELNCISMSESLSSMKETPVITGENSVETGRDKRGRFTYGNTFSIGNKGGRPRRYDLEDLLFDPEILEAITQYDGAIETRDSFTDLVGRKIEEYFP